MPPGFLHQALCPGPAQGSEAKAWGSPTAGHSTSQLCKDTATHMATYKKDLKGQALSVLQLQHRDQLFQPSTSHSLELRKQDLTSGWAQQGRDPTLAPTLAPAGTSWDRAVLSRGARDWAGFRHSWTRGLPRGTQAIASWAHATPSPGASVPVNSLTPRAGGLRPP